MGFDKATLAVDGVTLAERTAALLNSVLETVIEVGPGHTSLPTVREDPPGGGPLAAVAAGARHLLASREIGSVVVLATDLPRVSLPFLQRLATHPSPRSVVPVVGGRPQWVAARWSAPALQRAVTLVAAGHRRMSLLADDADWLVEPTWDDELIDVDTPADLVRGGLCS